MKTDNKCTAANERFGATAAGRADLKGSAGSPPAPIRHPVVGNAATASYRECRTEKSTARKRNYFENLQRE